MKKNLFSYSPIWNRSSFKICFKVPASNFKYERVFTLFHVLQTNCQATERFLEPAMKYQFAQVNQTSLVFQSEADEIIVMVRVGSAVNGSSFSQVWLFPTTGFTAQGVWHFSTTQR